MQGEHTPALSLSLILRTDGLRTFKGWLPGTSGKSRLLTDNSIRQLDLDLQHWTGVRAEIYRVYHCFAASAETIPPPKRLARHCLHTANKPSCNSSSTCLCVFFTLSVLCIHRHLAHPVYVPILHARETQALWSPTTRHIGTSHTYHTNSASLFFKTNATVSSRN